MNKPQDSHITHRFIQTVIDKKESQKESPKISEHLKSCDRCKNFVDLVQEARELAAGSSFEPFEEHPSRSDLSELLNQLYEQSLQPAAAAAFLNHLKSCQKCFQYLETVLEETFCPLEEEIDVELEAYSKISIADKVLQKIPPASTKRLPFFRFNYESLREKFLSPGLPVPQIAFAAVMVIVISIGSFWGINYYSTTYKLNQATSLLRNNYRVYMEDNPRLSGEYVSTGIRMLMSSKDSTIGEKPDTAAGTIGISLDKTTEMPDTYLAKAFDFTEQALANGSESPRTKQLQAHIFFIQNEYSKADSVLNQLNEYEQNTAEILNDRGVLRFSEGDWQTAAEYFKSAIQIDSKFKEAYYNLALAQDKLGQKEAAISTLKKYLILEDNEGWKNAGLNFLQKLQRMNN